MKRKENSKLRVPEGEQPNTAKEVVCFMKKSWLLAILFGLSIGILLCHGPAQAQVICAQDMNQINDYDKDGFTDYQECYGITLTDRATQATTGVCGLVACGGNPNNLNPNPSDRASRLDPNSPDLFAILIPAQPSNFPANFNAFEFVSNLKSAGGLEITVHSIKDSQANRDDTNPDNDRWLLAPNGQKAVRIREDLNVCSARPCSNYTGSPNYCVCDLGTSYRGNVQAGWDNATIYTARIKQEIEVAYGSLAAAPAGFYEKYMKHTIAHELGHMLSLTLSSQNNYHYAAKSNYTLDQYVYRKGTNWILGTKYPTTDQSNLHMIP